MTSVQPPPKDLSNTPMGQTRLHRPMVSRASNPIAWAHYDEQRRAWYKAGRLAGKEIAKNRELHKELAKQIAKANAKKKAIDMTKAAAAAKPVKLDDSIAGKKGKFGGMSPYTDADAALAKEYLKEMGKDTATLILDANHSPTTGRLAYHMIAEYAAHQNKQVLEQLHKATMQSNGVLVTTLTNSNLAYAQQIQDMRDVINMLERQLTKKSVVKEDFEQMTSGRKIKDLD
jgi:hypothetical protein